MARAFERKLRAVRVRCGINGLLRDAAVVLAAAGGVAVLAVVAEKLLSVPIVTLWGAAILAGVAVAAIVALGVLRAPGRMQVAVLMDRRLAFRERFSTTLALSSSDDPFARAAAGEAHRAAERLDVGGQFRVVPTWHWLPAGAAWIAALAVLRWMPEVDLLGYLAREKEQQTKAARLQQAKVEVKEAVSKVEAAIQNTDNKVLAAELAEFAKLGDGAKPAEVRRDAIRKLSDLSERLREMQKSEAFRAAEQTRQMLKGLRSDPNGLSRELNRALASGQFKQAAQTLKDLLRKANEGELSDKEREALARQLKELAGQLERLANEAKRLEEKLQDEGFDAETAGKLARMSEKDLREALQKQGLTPEQIEELMQKLSATSQACRNCSALGGAMGRCCGVGGALIPGELVGVIEATEGMERLSGELADLEMIMSEIERACAVLGEGDCQGGVCTGDKGLYALGTTKGRGVMGPGGLGRGYGLRPAADSGTTGFKKTAVRNKPSDGPVVASMYFKGPQVKGESKRKLSTAVKAAKDAAAEAISDNKIPRKYEGSVKKYFGEFEKTASDGTKP